MVTNNSFEKKDENISLKDKLDYYATSCTAYDHYAAIAKQTMQSLYDNRTSVDVEKSRELLRQNQNAENMTNQLTKVKQATEMDIINDPSFVAYSRNLINQSSINGISLNDKINYLTAANIAFDHYAAIADQTLQTLHNERGSLDLDRIKGILAQNQEVESNAKYYTQIKTLTTESIIQDPSFIDYSANIVTQQELAPTRENSLPTNILK